MSAQKNKWSLNSRDGSFISNSDTVLVAMLSTWNIDTTSDKFKWRFLCSTVLLRDFCEQVHGFGKSLHKAP